MPLTVYSADALLDHMFKGAPYAQPAAIYMSLHTTAPGDAGGNEVVGGSYARVDVSTAYAAASAKTKVNALEIVFPSMPAVTVTHVGIWDALTAGNMLLWGVLSVPQAVTAGEPFRISAGAAPMTAV